MSAWTAPALVGTIRPMGVGATLRYRFQVNLVGAGYLRAQRWSAQWRLRRRREGSRLFAPPLASGPRLKELISRHYLSGRHANGHRKVAWVTGGAPVEPLAALGYYTLYPENHAVVCSVRRVAEDLAGEAEAQGYSRDLCSYARIDLGSLRSGRTPVGRLPRPDLLVCCTNTCQTVLYWYRVLADHFRVPLIVIDTPFVYGAPAPHAEAFVRRQVESGIEVAERVAGRSLDERELRGVMRRSREVVDLWRQVLALGRRVPSPITAFEAFIHMAPVVEMRAEQVSVDYYRLLLAELEGRAARAEGAVRTERIRLVWDNLPLWPRLKWLSEVLAERGAVLVASTYTNAWGELAELIDPEHPLDSIARTYLRALINRGVEDRLGVLKRLVGDYGARGVVLHSDRSCKPYSVGQLSHRERLSDQLGVPAVLLEADHADSRAISDAQIATRLGAFLELLEA